MFLFYSIFDHFYVIINDLYTIVFHYNSMTSIYIPNFLFVFYITIFVLYNRNLYSIFSYLYLISSFFISILYFRFIFCISMFLLHNCLFTFNYFYFIRCFTFVFNTQDTAKPDNDMCALLGLMRVFAMR